MRSNSAGSLSKDLRLLGGGGANDVPAVVDMAVQVLCGAALVRIAQSYALRVQSGGLSQCVVCWEGQ